MGLPPCGCQEWVYHVLCYNISMNLQDISYVLSVLRQRLAPPEQAPFMEDLIEGRHPQARQAAVLLALFEKEAETHALFIKRSSTLRVHSGQMALPGGGVEPTDTSPVMTALREAQEEIGLDPARVEVLGLLNAVFTVVSNYLIVPVVAYLPQGPGVLHTQPGEVAEIITARLHTLANPAIAHTEQWTHDGQNRTVYFYDYGAYRIWGVTGRILSEFLALLQAPFPS
jgi:8-oxo-dGTP pyrophosphatase MutT (NUDIX family)